MILQDTFGRRVTYVRVSVTDRCNYRCVYCMPEEGVDVAPRADVLTFEEVARVVRILASMGTRRVRLTGGEPTVRRGLADLVKLLAEMPGVEELCMTTNGHLLGDLAAPLREAGLASVNVSLDTLRPERFAALTRRGDLGRVLAGIEAARAVGFSRLRINAVAMRGWNDDELGDLCRYAWERGMTPRFIEWMPMGEGSEFAPGTFLAAAEVRAGIERQLGGRLVPTGARAGQGPARYWRHEPGRHEVGVIAALTENFCADCNRVRLTATGRLHACLASDRAADLRALVRSGAGDERIRRTIVDELLGKREGHEFTTEGCGGPRAHMVAIGG
jgi:GTP 3',8-cyclase